MGVKHVVEKGKDGERKIATDLNTVIWRVLTAKEMEHTFPIIVQRNGQQSSVGGKDLIGTFNLAIEIKCQEQLAINTWWDQCVKQAKRNNEFPVLLYKQNYKGYKAVTFVQLYIDDGKSHWVRATFDYEDFLKWFEAVVIHQLETGYQLKL